MTTLDTGDGGGPLKLADDDDGDALDFFEAAPRDGAVVRNTVGVGLLLLKGGGLPVFGSGEEEDGVFVASSPSQWHPQFAKEASNKFVCPDDVLSCQ